MALLAALLAAATTFTVITWDDIPLRTTPDHTNAGPPNILLITSDDQRADDMVAMRRTRELIGQRGTTFDRAYATFPLCCPSRASMLTGQYAHNHGVLGNGDNGVGGYREFDNSSTLATWLEDAGYRTSFVGKYLNGYGAVQPRTVPVGWAEWQTSVAGGNYQRTRIFDGESVAEYDDYQTDLYAELAGDALERGLAGSQPLFLWASFFAPHSGTPSESDDPGGIQTPAVADRHRDAFDGLGLPDNPSVDEADVSDKPADIATRERLGPATERGLAELREQRLESLLALDEAVQRLLGVLESSGEWDNTLVVFTSDNGYMIGEHRIQGGKLVPYEPSARVPLLVSGPGFPRGVVREQPVGLIDLAPTLVEASGVSAGLSMDGVSLQGPAGDPDVGAERTLLLESGPDAVGGPIRYGGARTGRYVYVEYVDGEQEFYDLRADPYQLENLAADPDQETAALIEQYADRARRLAGCSGSDCSLS
ncbi:MAG: sulfatase [Geodermatophilaceae bacterium]|nr:sulfatase [Geodermatophilaceae bacterium]MDQ3454364.1 sulfatase [Actinomycetota bacterium]